MAHKIISAAISLLMLSTMPTASKPLPHGGGGDYRGGYYAQPRGFPFGAALGLGILGAGLGAYYYQNRCYRYVIDYDDYGNPITQIICQ